MLGELTVAACVKWPSHICLDGLSVFSVLHFHDGGDGGPAVIETFL